MQMKILCLKTTFMIKELKNHLRALKYCHHRALWTNAAETDIWLMNRTTLQRKRKTPTVQRCDGGGGGEFMGRCHFEFAYLYELICNAKSIQRFKGTLQCDWLLVWSPDTLFVHYFAHLPIYLGVEFLLEGLHTSVSRFCCCCVFQMCFSCLKNMCRPCYWQEAKQPRYRGRINIYNTAKHLYLRPWCILIYIWIILVGQQ